jgi:hypothetical protein
MTASQPEPSAARFFGAALIAVGVLMMFLCGGCGALFFIAFTAQALSNNPEDLGMLIMPIVLGGVPAGVGLLLFWAGRKLRKPAPLASSPDDGQS